MLVEDGSDRNGIRTWTHGSVRASAPPVLFSVQRATFVDTQIGSVTRSHADADPSSQLDLVDGGHEPFEPERTKLDGQGRQGAVAVGGW